MDEGIKRAILKLTSKEYATIRLICKREPLTVEVLERHIRGAVLDRVQLGLSFYSCARSLPLESDGTCRSIISRCYYCCYHLARALVFLVTRGDVDEHRKLPKVLRGVLRREDHYLVDALSQWRDIRNEVEYSPFPRIDVPLAEAAAEALRVAEGFIQSITRYFEEGGVRVDDWDRTAGERDR